MRNNERPNAGWKLEDQHYLRKTDPNNDPDIQILTEEDWEDEDKERREYWCAICKSKLEMYLDTPWFCAPIS
ncbi:MAG: hypothetical protein WA941_12545 [Nitrososphaeraceae archaeon]